MLHLFRRSRSCPLRCPAGVVACALSILALGALPVAAQTTRRISVATDGTQGNDHSTTSLYGWSSAVFGNLAAFSSFASNLVPQDDNNLSDVFVRDISGNVTELISHSIAGSIAGGSGNGTSYHPAISRDGRWVAFASLASDLVLGDTNNAVDVFLYDRLTATMRCITLGGNGDSSFPTIAVDPANTTVHVAFTSSASNLIVGDTNGVPDIFHYSLNYTTLVSTIVRASQDPGGLQGDEASVVGTISATGRFIVYTSYIWNIIPPTPTKPLPPVLQILLYDAQAGGTIFRLITTPDAGTIPTISGDGRFFCFVQNGKIILYDWLLRAAETVSVSSDGIEANGVSFQPSISQEGRFVAFASAGTNLVPGDNNGAEDIFVRDRASRQTVRVSLAQGGTETNGHSRAPSISEDGRRVIYSSSATNIVAGDTNGKEDAFVVDWQPSMPAVLPDMMLKKSTDIWHVGNNVYNNTGADQTVTQPCSPGPPAIYHLRVQNDGASPDSFVITANPPSGAWVIQFFDALVGGVDITAAVTGPGWTVGPLAPQASVDFRLEVSVPGASPPQLPLQTLVTATSVADVTKADTVRAVTTDTRALPARPDMLIKNLADAAYTGDNIYNNTGLNQTVSQILQADNRAVYLLTVQNDGSAPDSFNITAVGAAPGWDVTFFDANTGGNDITAAVMGAGWNSGILAPAATRDFRLEVAYGPSVVPGSSLDILVTATSTTEPDKLDTVKATTTRAIVPQPDMLIRNVEDAMYSGNDVFNTTGAGQTVAHSATTADPAVYPLKVQNDGNLPDSFAITGTGSSNGWVVTYFDALVGGTDITAQVTGAGWNTGSMAPGTAREFRVEVAVEPGVPPPGPKEVLVLAASNTDATRRDAVKAVTTQTAITSARPDMMIRNQGAPVYLGNDIYNNTGADQSVVQVPQWDGTELAAIYELRLQNDRTTVDNFVVTGNGGGGGWTVTYYDDVGGNDITALVTGPGWQVNGLAPQAMRNFRVKVAAVNPASPPPTAHTLIVTATSPTDPTKLDTVMALTTVQPGQPDMLIRRETDAAYLGDGIYNDTGAQQTAFGQTTWTGTEEVAVYAARLENDGPTTDSFLVTGTGGGSGWRVTYISGGNDITARVTGGGWPVDFLPPGASVDIEVRVALAVPGVPPAGPHNLLLRAVSMANPARRDAVGAITIKAGAQPDLLIRASGTGPYLGDNVYNTTGLDQTIELPATWNGQVESAAYEIKLQNDGLVTDTFVVTASPGGGGWNVTYESGGNDITALLSSTGWLVSNLAPGGSTTITATVTLQQPGVPPPAPHSLWVNARSQTDPNLVDVVRSVTSKQPAQPDLHVKSQADEFYFGADLYGTDGLNQSISQTADWAAPAIYDLRLENDGTVWDTYFITGTPAGAGWQVSFVDLAEGNDVTVHVTGAGWRTQPIPPGQSRQYRLVVELAGPDTPPQAPMEMLIRATSASGAVVMDTVRTVTTQKRPASQPDMLVKYATDPLFIGGGILNATGNNQTAEHTAAWALPAVYHIKLQNTGPVEDTFIITGNGGVDGWKVAYYDALTGGTDVTAQVTGSEWPVGPLAPGSSVSFRVEVGIEPGLLPEAPLTVLVKARSTGDTSKADVIGALTTRTPLASQPDLLIRDAASSFYLGNNIYNATGQDQSATATATWDQPAVYHIKLQNDASLTDGFIVRGPGSSDGWTITYYDALAGGADITSQVTGPAGWSTANLPPGGSLQFRVEVALEPGVPPQAPRDLLITAISQADSTRSDAVLATTRRSGLASVPDVLIRRASDALYTGNDIYGVTGENQSVSQAADYARPAIYHIKVQNDGSLTDSFIITGSPGGAGWQVRYFDALTGGSDRTSLVTGAGWNLDPLPAGGAFEFRAEVAVEPGVPPPAPHVLLVTAKSFADTTNTDTARGVTSPSGLASRADMLIRNATDTWYTGNDIYNTTAENQAVAQSARLDAPAVYILKLQNDGQVNGSFTITASAGGAGWRVAYFDAASGGNDITAQLTGAGWPVPELRPGESLELRAEVSLDPGVGSQLPFDILVRAKSTSDDADSDTVRATTTRSADAARPDMLIRNQDDSWYVGDNAYNATGEGQLALQTARPDAPAVYVLKLQNDGPVAGSFLLKGSAGGNGWTVTYFDAPSGGADVTAQITGDGLQVGPLSPGANRELRAEVALEAGVSPQAPHQLLLTAQSVLDSTSLDAVQAMTSQTTAASQPDMLIRNMADTPYVGNDIYNATGENQSVAQVAHPAQPAIYALKLQNDGALPNSFLVTGTGSANGWQVRYYDALASGNDITSLVTGSGWHLASVAAGGVVEFRAEVSLEAGVTPPGPYQLLVKAKSTTDTTRTDTVGAATTRGTLAVRPDLLIRNTGTTLYVGNDVYNTTGENQTVSQAAQPLAPAIYELKVHNDGQLPDSFAITGTPGGAGWQVTYYDALSGGNDITAQVTSAAGWSVPDIGPGEGREFRVEVALEPGVPPQAPLDLLVTAKSLTDTTRTDTVRATTSRGPQAPQPDLLIRNATETWYVGDDVINSTGQGQSASQTAQRHAPAVFHLKLQNNGTLADTFVLRGAAGGEGWVVHYFDALTQGQDISAQITGTNGWTTPSLIPGASLEIRLEVAQDQGVPATNARKQILVTAKASSDANKLDAVEAVTNPVEPRRFTRTFSPGLWMLGVPAEPVAPRADVVLGTEPVATWDAATQQYRFSTDQPFNLTPGKGCFARWTQTHQVSFEGFPPAGPVVHDLQRDWNLLANPSDSNLPWTSVVATGSVQPWGWTLNDAGTGYTLISALSLANAQQSLAPWQGFWLKANEACQVTIGATTTSAPAPSDLIRWAVQVGARAGKATDECNYIGVANAATPITGSEPPALGKGAVSLSAVDAAHARNAVSLVAATDQPVWDLVVDTDLPRTRVEIFYPDCSAVPNHLGLILEDLDTGRTINMRTTQSYSFVTGEKGAQRHLRITAAPRTTQLAVTSASAQPAGGKLQVNYVLSAPADVQMDILNIGGRKVGSVALGFQAAGTHTAFWAGTGRTGTRLPAGHYLITIRCKADDGTQVSRVIPAQLR